MEINATFHGLQKVDTFKKWCLEVPPPFLFALKAHEGMTHHDRLKDIGHLWEPFLQRAEEGLGSRLGPILFQLPPSFHRDDERLREFASLMPGHRLRIAIEFRHVSWFCPEVFAILRAHNLALVENYTPDNSYPFCDEVTANFTYVRMHKKLAVEGEEQETVYTDELLEPRIVEAVARRRQGITQFVYFLNDIKAHGPHNAQRFLEQVVARTDGVPAVSGWKPAPKIVKGGKGSLENMFARQKDAAAAAAAAKTEDNSTQPPAMAAQQAGLSSTPAVRETEEQEAGQSEAASQQEEPQEEPQEDEAVVEISSDTESAEPAPPPAKRAATTDAKKSSTAASKKSAATAPKVSSSNKASAAAKASSRDGGKQPTLNGFFSKKS